MVVVVVVAGVVVRVAVAVAAAAAAATVTVVILRVKINNLLAAALRWFTAGGAFRIAVRQLLQTWKLCHYDVIDDVVTRKL